MPLECPRCLATNLDADLPCSCGYDPSAAARQRLASTPADSPSLTASKQAREMTLWNFTTGLGIVWLTLAVSEAVRLNLDRATRTVSRLIEDSLLIGTTDLAGALTAGALAWIAVYMLRSYEAIHYHPCPKRTALTVTVITAVLFFLGRLLSPGVILQAVLPGLVVLGAMGLGYYAGSRQWLGKW